MSKIKVLDQKTANKIAAGEVIINPASVIKELLENAIDAKSNSIVVEIKKGGKEYISIKDNGEGISYEDAAIAFQRHTTSKINRLEDLEKTKSLGFRGEALASIAAVSKIKMITKERHANTGAEIQIQGGKLVKSAEIGCSPGTYIRVEDLFYNTPARYKYLKKDSIEAGYVGSIIERIALSHPEISIKFINEERQIFHTPGNNDLYSCIYSLFGKDFAHHLMEISYFNEPLRIQGFIGKPQLTKSKRTHQIFFVNQRYIKNRTLHNALDEAFKGLIMIHRLPVCVLSIELPPDMLDINVHPAKTEILFRNESLIYLLLKQAITDCLKKEQLITEVTLSDQKYETREQTGEKVLEQLPLEMTDTPITHQRNPQKDKLLYHEAKGMANEGSEDQQIAGNKKHRESGSHRPGNHIKSPDANKNNGNILEQLTQGKVIGQIFSTYIIIELGNQLYLIDQHAAHERILYNRFKEEYKNHQVLSQKLMLPIHMEASFYEIQLILDFQGILNKMGFEIEEFGNNSILIRSVPILLGQPQNSDFIIELLHHLEEIKDIPLVHEQENKLITMACKSAIKANDTLKTEEIYQLINDLMSTEQPYTCPHGRPIIVKLTKFELEKMFKRIQ